MAKMEVFLYNSTVCRLCGEENDNGTLLYTSDENNQDISELINKYLPVKVRDDGQLPRTVCPGCTIQLEATIEFLNLIVKGQTLIRELYLREKEFKKSVLNNPPENLEVCEIDLNNPVFPPEHAISLQMAGLIKPRRKRGRPPKKQKTPEELAQEAAEREKEMMEKQEEADDKAEETPGKRRRKAPTKYMEAVQGKELERIFIEEGVIDANDVDPDVKPDIASDMSIPKEPEIIGHLQESGEVVVMSKGKGRGRPKGRTRATRENCAICGMEFSCVGRYMSHVAQHGPVLYQCLQCDETFDTRLLFTTHQGETKHEGQNVIARPVAERDHDAEKSENTEPFKPPLAVVPPSTSNPNISATPKPLPPLTPLIKPTQDPLKLPPHGIVEDKVPDTVLPPKNDSTGFLEGLAEKPVLPEDENTEVDKDVVVGPTGKPKLKCNFCDKLFSSKQSKSVHIKAIHRGEKNYVCSECNAAFAYPRSLALHRAAHRRRPARGFACDLCGKVLNHPSSVIYHKEAEHAGQKYVCNKCGKCFKHKQLLTRHQLVHTQARPYSCKQCDTSFKTKGNLLNHTLLHSGIKKYSCDICKHRFAHKTSLTLHMRWHSGEKPYKCSVCDKSFTQKGNLSEHARIHTGEKPFQCAACRRRFTTSSQCRLHARRHAAGAACARCGKRFSNQAACQAHQRRVCNANALGNPIPIPKPHVCPTCSRGFTEKAALLRHLRVHTGERPYRCPYCPRAFADCSNLNKHKKQVHKRVSLLHPQEPLQVALDKPEPGEGVVLGGAGGERVVLGGAGGERVVYVSYGDGDEPFIIEAGEEEDEDSQELEVDSKAPREVPEEVPREGAHVRPQHMPVTDEDGNPLHFTMHDGTRLAITSVDGKTLQVITHDGQTIPVEINGYGGDDDDEEPEEEIVSSPVESVVHHLNLQKSSEPSDSEQVTYFTIV